MARNEDKWWETLVEDAYREGFNAGLSHRNFAGEQASRPGPRLAESLCKDYWEGSTTLSKLKYVGRSHEIPSLRSSDG